MKIVIVPNVLSSPVVPDFVHNLMPNLIIHNDGTCEANNKNIKNNILYIETDTSERIYISRHSCFNFISLRKQR